MVLLTVVSLLARVAHDVLVVTAVGMVLGAGFVIVNLGLLIPRLLDGRNPPADGAETAPRGAGESLLPDAAPAVSVAPAPPSQVNLPLLGAQGRRAS